MPKEIVWGEPLPICGYLRVGEELRIKQPQFSFVLERKDQRLAEYRADDTQELGDPMMDKKSPAYGLLQKNGELYFNVDGQHPFRDLSPGEYDIVIGYLDLLQTEKKHLKVIPGGWRASMSDALVTAICDGNILADLSEYLSLMRTAALIDVDEAGQAEMARKIEAAWRKGFARYKGKIADQYRSKLKSLNSVDQSIPFYAYKSSQLKCSSTHVEIVALLDLFAGVRRWESLP
jgi:hypothetical protein